MHITIFCQIFIDSFGAYYYFLPNIIIFILRSMLFKVFHCKALNIYIKSPGSVNYLCPLYLHVYMNSADVSHKFRSHHGFMKSHNTLWKQFFFLLQNFLTL